MNLLSKEVETMLVDKIFERCDKILSQKIKELSLKHHFVHRTDLMEELGVGKAFIFKLEASGLKRISFDESDRTVFYKRSDVIEIMNRLAK